MFFPTLLPLTKVPLLLVSVRRTTNANGCVCVWKGRERIMYVCMYVKGKQRERRSTPSPRKSVIVAFAISPLRLTTVDDVVVLVARRGLLEVDVAVDGAVVGGEQERE